MKGGGGRRRREKGLTISADGRPRNNLRLRRRSKKDARVSPAQTRDSDSSSSASRQLLSSLGVELETEDSQFSGIAPRASEHCFNIKSKGRARKQARRDGGQTVGRGRQTGGVWAVARTLVRAGGGFFSIKPVKEPMSFVYKCATCVRYLATLGEAELGKESEREMRRPLPPSLPRLNPIN